VCSFLLLLRRRTFCRLPSSCHVVVVRRRHPPFAGRTMVRAYGSEPSVNQKDYLPSFMQSHGAPPAEQCNAVCYVILTPPPLCVLPSQFLHLYHTLSRFAKCLEFHAMHTLFPHDPAFCACTTCCRPYLRTNKHSELWLARLAAGDLNESAPADVLKATSSRRCAKTGESYPKGVGSGWCLDCYFVHQLVTFTPRLACTFLLHGLVSTNKPPKVAPSPAALHLLWTGAKAAE